MSDVVEGEPGPVPSPSMLFEYSRDRRMAKQLPAAPTWPVSVKGIVPIRGGVVVLHNERDEWELPGGRLESGESPEECLRREILEEVGVTVTVDELVDAWMYPVLPGRTVLVLTYACTCTDAREPRTSEEHDAIAVVPLARVAELQMPFGFKASIRRWQETNPPPLAHLSS